MHLKKSPAASFALSGRFLLGRFLLGRPLLGLFLLSGLSAIPVAAQEQGIDVDFLLNYYDQDGEHSPVTGGIGTEDLQVLAPVFVVKWAVSEDWTLKMDFGVDSITSASTDNIDAEVSSASRQDQRAYSTVTASRRQGENQTWRFGVGFSNEYDYSSLSGRVGWTRDFDQRNTTLALGLGFYSDSIDLYDIEGVNQSSDDRQTIDFSASLTRVLGPRTVGSVEFSYTGQSGFLSTPFHEVILTPTSSTPDGERIAERLPDSRERIAAGLSLNHSLTKRVVQRLYYRFYNDDWGIQAHTVEAETHFRLPTENDIWIFPILRFYTQTGSDYFTLPRTVQGSEPFFTADRDLSEFTSEKFGFGLRLQRRNPKKGFFSRLRSFESRLTTYSRDDGLDALSLSLAFGWRF